MFEDSKTFRYFLKLRQDMSQDDREKFSLMVRRAFDKKITSEKALKCYYITMFDLQLLSYQLQKAV